MLLILCAMCLTQVEGEQLYLTIVTEGDSRYRFHVNTGEFTPLP